MFCFFNCFLERGREREKNNVREKHGLVASHMRPNWASNLQHFVHRVTLQPAEPPDRGWPNCNTVEGESLGRRGRGGKAYCWSSQSEHMHLLSSPSYLGTVRVISITVVVSKITGHSSPKQ